MDVVFPASLLEMIALMGGLQQLLEKGEIIAKDQYIWLVRVLWRLCNLCLLHLGSANFTLGFERFFYRRFFCCCKIFASLL